MSPPGGPTPWRALLTGKIRPPGPAPDAAAQPEAVRVGAPEAKGAAPASGAFRYLVWLRSPRRSCSTRTVAVEFGGGVYWNSSSAPNSMSSTLERNLPLAAMATPLPIRANDQHATEREALAGALALRLGDRDRGVPGRRQGPADVGMQPLVFEQRASRHLPVGQPRVRASCPRKPPFACSCAAWRRWRAAG